MTYKADLKTYKCEHFVSRYDKYVEYTEVSFRPSPHSKLVLRVDYGPEKIKYYADTYDDSAYFMPVMETDWEGNIL